MESGMKIAVLALATGLALPAAALADEPATAHNNVCLPVSNIMDTTVVDDQTILYRMNNGKVWRNTLPRRCPDLKFENGFTEVVHADEVCSHLQTIYVLHTRTPCMLGDFTLEPPAAKKQ